MNRFSGNFLLEAFNSFVVDTATDALTEGFTVKGSIIFNGASAIIGTYFGWNEEAERARGLQNDFSAMGEQWASSSFHRVLDISSVVIQHSEWGTAVSSRPNCESIERLEKLNSLLPEDERISWERFLINPTAAFEAYLSLSIAQKDILSEFSPSTEGREWR